MSLPPGPRGHWLFGNAVDFRRDRLRFLERLAADFGPVASFLLGLRRWCLVSDCRDVERILRSDAEGFRKPRALTVAGRLFFGDALTATDGDTWRRRRKLVAPLFAPSAVAPLLDAAGSEADAIAAAWKDGATIRGESDLGAAVARVCGTALLGMDLSGEAPAIVRAMETALEGLGERVRSPLPTPDWLPTEANRKMKRGMCPIRAVVERGMASASSGTSQHASLLRTLLAARERASGVDDTVVRDEAAIMMALGAHQITVALLWTLVLLAQHEGVATRVAAELEAAVSARRPPGAGDLERLEYTSFVVDESLRLYPPFFLLLREARRDVLLGGFRIREGSTVAVSPYVSHRSAAHFEEPRSFRPERWAGGLRMRLPPMAYFPFGGGPRVCVANHVARAQLILMTAAFTRRFRFELVNENEIRPRASVALGFRTEPTFALQMR